MPCAQEELVTQNMDWSHVEAVLANYPNLGRFFTLEELQENQPPPYFCHYLAFRITKWREHGGERYLELFDKLVAKGTETDGWNEYRLSDASYDSYWTILWELQVADALQRHPDIGEVRWLPQGPDLQCCVDGAPCYVECYVYQKQYARLHYIEDLLQLLSPHFDVTHSISVRVCLPSDIRSFFDNLFRPFAEDSFFLDRLKREARETGRAELDLPESVSNVRIALTDPETPAPPDSQNAHGAGAFCGEGYVVNAVDEAVRNKKGKNSLECHRPNVIFINCLLARDYTADLAATLSFYGGELPDSGFADHDFVDAACFFAHGVDRRLPLSEGNAVYEARSAHPFGTILSCTS